MYGRFYYRTCLQKYNTWLRLALSDSAWFRLVPPGSAWPLFRNSSEIRLAEEVSHLITHGGGKVGIDTDSYSYSWVRGHKSHYVFVSHRVCRLQRLRAIAKKNMSFSWLHLSKRLMPSNRKNVVSAARRVLRGMSAGFLTHKIPHEICRRLSYYNSS